MLQARPREPEEMYHMIKYLLLLLGFFLLIKGADLFVDGSSSIARLLHVPSIIIGLTVVAFGTSMPEASVSVTAALAGKNDLSLSNVIGSNIFNLLIVVGVSAALQPMKVQASVLKKDLPLSIVLTALLLVMSIPTAYQGEKAAILSRPEGCILLAVFIAYLAVTVRQALKARQDYAEDEGPDGNAVISIPVTLIYVVIGIAGIVWGGNLVVDSASAIALTFGWSETFIGLTIVALGTSLPELVTSVMAARKGESDLALGNAVGSNLFNILLVLGMSASLHPITVSPFTVYDTIFLAVASIIVYLFAIQKQDLNRREGLMMIPLYFIFFIYIILR